MSIYAHLFKNWTMVKKFIDFAVVNRFWKNYQVKSSYLTRVAIGRFCWWWWLWSAAWPKHHPSPHFETLCHNVVMTTTWNGFLCTRILMDTTMWHEVFHDVVNVTAQTHDV